MDYYERKFRGSGNALRICWYSFIAILIIMFLSSIFIGCKTPGAVENTDTSDSVRTEYIEKIVKDTVTVTVEIPAETKERETRDSTSVLETSIARSTARLTWTDGQPWLFHSLENKPQQIQQQAEVDTKEKTRIEYKTRYVTKTKYVEVKKPFPWWSKILMWAGGISLAVLAIGISLHVIGKDINRLL